MWIYLFEDCDVCEGTGKSPDTTPDGTDVDLEATCFKCEGQCRYRSNLSFELPSTLLYPGGVDEEMAAP